MRQLATVLLGIFCALPIAAQTPEAALASQWPAICAGALSGSPLAQRCLEIATGGPGSADLAARGNFLDEIPGQGRSSTRDGSAQVPSTRQSIAANVSLFASVDLGRLTRRDSANEAAFSGDTGAFTAGIDWAPATRLLLGAALNHSRETLDYDASQGSSQARYTGLLGYAGLTLGQALTVDGYAGRLSGSNDLRRAIDYTLPSGVRVASAADADPGSRRRLSGIGLNWSLPRGAWQWQFAGGMDWLRTRIEAYDESNASGLALSVPQREIASRRARFDVSMGPTLSRDWGIWQPRLRVGWRREYANPSRALTVHFSDDSNATPITFDTEDPDSTWGEAGISSVFTFTHGHSGFIEYRQRFAHRFLQDRVLALGWRMELH